MSEKIKGPVEALLGLVSPLVGLVSRSYIGCKLGADARKTNQSTLIGQEWGKTEQPAEGVVAKIDSEEQHYRAGFRYYEVGLSAMQLDNLGIERQFRNEIGLLGDRDYGEDRDYGDLIVEFKGQKVCAQVYNACGTKGLNDWEIKGLDDCGIRVSSTLAEDLGLKLKDRVRLYSK